MSWKVSRAKGSHSSYRAGSVGCFWRSKGTLCGLPREASLHPGSPSEGAVARASTAEVKSPDAASACGGTDAAGLLARSSQKIREATSPRCGAIRPRPQRRRRPRREPGSRPAALLSLTSEEPRASPTGRPQVPSSIECVARLQDDATLTQHLECARERGPGAETPVRGHFGGEE